MTKVKDIEFQAIEFAGAGEAIQYAQATANGEAITRLRLNEEGRVCRRIDEAFQFVVQSKQSD